MPKNSYIVGFDIGTRKVVAVIGEVTEERKIEIIGIGTADSHGLRKGVVVDLDATTAAIKKAQEEAELMAGVEIDAAFFGISGAHIKSFNSRGVVAVSGKNREISREDVRRVVDQSKAIPIPPDRDIIHIIPQEFIVDDQDGIKDPVGMSGIKLEVNVHIITAALTSLQNLKSCIERAGIGIEEIVLNQIATAQAVLTQDERELGVGQIDIGAGTTEVAIYERGSLWYTVDDPHRRRQLHQRHRRRPADPHPRGRADQEEVRLHRRAARSRTRRRSRSRRSAKAASPGSCRASSWPTSSSRGPRRSSASSTRTSSAWATTSR